MAGCRADARATRPARGAGAGAGIPRHGRARGAAGGPVRPGARGSEGTERLRPAPGAYTMARARRDCLTVHCVTREGSSSRLQGRAAAHRSASKGGATPTLPPGCLRGSRKRWRRRAARQLESGEVSAGARAGPVAGGGGRGDGLRAWGGPQGPGADPPGREAARWPVFCSCGGDGRSRGPGRDAGQQRGDAAGGGESPGVCRGGAAGAAIRTVPGRATAGNDGRAHPPADARSRAWCGRASRCWT